MTAKERAQCVQLVDEISEKMASKRHHKRAFFKNTGCNTKIARAMHVPSATQMLNISVREQQQPLPSPSIPRNPAILEVSHNVPATDRHSTDSGVISSDEICVTGVTQPQQVLATVDQPLPVTVTSAPNASDASQPANSLPDVFISPNSLSLARNLSPVKPSQCRATRTTLPISDTAVRRFHSPR